MTLGSADLDHQLLRGLPVLRQWCPFRDSVEAGEPAAFRAGESSHGFRQPRLFAVISSSMSVAMIVWCLVLTTSLYRV